jgi:uncharacterized protein YbjQ (UPF0145 family)
MIGCLELNHYGKDVRVTSNPEVVRGCQFLGEVKGGEYMLGGSYLQEVAEENAYVDLKNKAGQMGANVVLFMSQTTNRSGSAARGEAYRCPKPSEASVSPR